MSNNYGDLFEDWEIRTAKRLIREFQRNWTCLKREDSDDLLQECLSHWQIARNKNNPKGEASQWAFRVRTIRNKLIDLVRKLESDKRRIAHLTVSLDAMTEVDEDLSFSLHAANSSSMSDSSFDPFIQIDLRIDLERAMQRLTPRQLSLCRMLGEEGYTIQEASEYLQVSRITVRNEVARIRASFMKDNLQDYLQPPPAISRLLHVFTR